MRFSNREKKDLWFAGMMISLAFAILLSGGYMALFSLNIGFVIVFVISFFTAGIGFLLHELMHKYVAQNYGLRAEFRAFYGMLWLAILFSLFGFIIAAPGAVFISGRITKERNGKISLAGPMTNIILALIFLVPLLLFDLEGLFRLFLYYGLSINSLLGLFNMIPVMPFDGAKIRYWDKGIHTLVSIIALGLFVVSFFIR